jgi:hypothetical protein
MRFSSMRWQAKASNACVHQNGSVQSEDGGLETVKAGKLQQQWAAGTTQEVEVTLLWSAHLRLLMHIFVVFVTQHRLQNDISYSAICSTHTSCVCSLHMRQKLAGSCKG